MMYLMAQEKENHFIVFFLEFFFVQYFFVKVRANKTTRYNITFQYFFIIILSTEKTELFEKHRLQPLNYSYSKNKWSFFLFNFRKIILYKYTVRSSSSSSCSIFLFVLRSLNFAFTNINCCCVTWYVVCQSWNIFFFREFV